VHDDIATRFDAHDSESPDPSTDVAPARNRNGRSR
jgi:hypothetical protein